MADSKGPYYVECGKCHKFIQECDQNAHAYECYIVRLEMYQKPGCSHPLEARSTNIKGSWKCMICEFEWTEPGLYAAI